MVWNFACRTQIQKNIHNKTVVKTGGLDQIKVKFHIILPGPIMAYNTDLGNTFEPKLSVAFTIAWDQQRHYA